MSTNTLVLVDCAVFFIVCIFTRYFLFFLLILRMVVRFFFFSSRRRHTRCALVTGVQTCALPISQAVAAKTATFGYVDVPTMMRAAVKGAPVEAVGVALQTSPMSAMGFADKNIRKPEDIKGKTVATTPGDSMSQIRPLFLKQTGLKESDFKTVSGDGTTKLNAVINGLADLLLGYVMDQSMKIKDATGKNVYPIKFADYGIHLVSSGIIANQEIVKERTDMVRSFLAASTREIGRESGRERVCPYGES